MSTAAILSNSIPFYKELYDRMMLYQETLKPDKDVQFIVEQYHTGRFCPRPPLYVNYFHGAAIGIYYINKYKYKNIPFLLFFFFFLQKILIFHILYLFHTHIYRSVVWGIVRGICTNS